MFAKLAKIMQKGRSRGDGPLHLGGFGRICEDLEEFGRIWENLQGFARISENFPGFAKIFENLRRFIVACLITMCYTKVHR